jgi:hypothetical protein
MYFGGSSFMSSYFGCSNPKPIFVPLGDSRNLVIHLSTWRKSWKVNPLLYNSFSLTSVLTIHCKCRVMVTPDHTQWHLHSVWLLWTRDRPFAEASTCTTHNTHKRRIYQPTSGFEPATPKSEGPQTQALDFTATAIGLFITHLFKIITK